MKKLFKKLISLTLIGTYLTVFCTTEVSFASSTAEATAGFSKETSFVSFDAVTASQADPFTGSATMSVPIFVPPGRKGLTPDVSLSYSSRGGNSWMGVGWSYDFGRIERSTKRGVPDYDDNTDTFVLNFGGASSELVSIGSGEYRMKHEALFMKIEKNATSWEVTDKSGTKYFFGETADSKKENSLGTFSWHLNKVQDINGNTMEYDYQEFDDQLYPLVINYNGHTSGFAHTHSVNFELEDRNDDSISFISGARVETRKRLKAIEVKVGTTIARRYEVTYEYSSSSNRSRIIDIKEFGVGGTNSLPPIEFTYTDLQKSFDTGNTFTGVDSLPGLDSNYQYLEYSEDTSSYKMSALKLLDLNGDGLLDRMYKKSASDMNFYFRKGKLDGTGFETTERQITNGWAPSGGGDHWKYFDSYETGQSATWVKLFDINGDGFVDRLLNYGSDSICEMQICDPIDSAFDPMETTAINTFGESTFEAIQERDGNGWTQMELADMNGDGFPDRVMYDDAKSPFNQDNHWRVQKNNGDGTFGTTEVWPTETVNSERKFEYISTTTGVGSGTSVQNSLMDINGDGLPDRIIQEAFGGTYWKVQFNNGKSFEPLEIWGGTIEKDGMNELAYIQNVVGSSGTTKTRAVLMDINADGLPDRVLKKDGSSSNFKVQLNTGVGFGASENWSGIDDYGTSSLGYIHEELSNSAKRSALIDIDGDGLLERIVQNSTSNNYFNIQNVEGDFPDLLKTVKNGRGGTTTFEYNPSTRYDNTDTNGVSRLPFPLQLVESINLNDGHGHDYTTSYDYKGGMFDFEDREFRGFGEVTITDPEGNKSIQYYHQDDTKQGKLHKKEIYDSQDNLYAKSETDWQVTNPNTGVNFVYVDKEDEFVYEGDASFKQRTTSFTYDAYGNLLTTLEEGETGVTGDERTTINEYTYNTTDWILNTLARTELQDENSVKIAEKFFMYDGAGTHTAQPSKGNLTKEEEWLDTGVNPTTQMTYDTYGNILTITDALGNVTTNTFDTTYHQFLEKVTNALGHEQQFTYSATHAKILTTTDPNGAVTQTIYDEFGRPLKVIEPGDTVALPTKQFEYRPYTDDPHSPFQCERIKVEVREVSGTNQVLTTYSFVDGLSRKIQTRIEATPDPVTSAARQIVTDMVVYDSRGQVISQYVPFFDSFDENCAPVPAGTPTANFEYDSVGRKNKTTLPDGSTSETEFDDWQVTVRTNNSDSTNEQVMTRLMDAYGRITEVHEFNGGSQYTTQYEYDARDNLTLTRDDQFNTTTLAYDSLGRKTTLNDPDTGTTTYTYDANGNLKTQTDANTNTITFTYDVLNRVTVKDFAGGTSDVYYTYEDPVTPVANTIGRLVTVSNGNAIMDFEYDVKGRVTKETETIDAIGYSYEYAYDALGRKTEITYPDLVKILYFFDEGGAINEVGMQIGVDVYPGFYVQDVQYNASGLRTSITYGNGVVTNYAYDPQMLRLSGITTTDALSNTIQDFDYNFDNNGNVLSIIDNVNTATQYFTYDDLNRLTRATGNYGVLDYSYDSIGNLLNKEGLTMTYGENGAGPHQVTSASDGRTFQYDANGNMTDRGSDALTYDEDNRLSTISREEGLQQSITYTLKQGWNLISFPTLPDNESVSSVLSGVNFSQLSYYDNVAAEWKHYVNDAEFSDFSQLTRGVTYQIYIDDVGGTTFGVSGRLSHFDLQLSLKTGTNYVSPTGTGSATIGDFLSGITYDWVKKLNADTGLYETMQSTDPVGLGEGYAVSVSSDQTLTLSADGCELVAVANFTYGPNGDRIKKTVNGTTSIYIGSAFEKEGTDEVKYIFLDDFKIGEFRSNGGLFFHHTDHLNSTNVVTNAAGEQAKLYEYSPFGTTVIDETAPAEDPTLDFDHKFTGQREDAEIALYYYNARYYDPELGRFIQADSFVQSPYDPQSFNRYAYARNNPIKFTDPSGNFFGIFAAVAAIFKAVAAVAAVATQVVGAVISAAITVAKAAVTVVAKGVGFVGNALKTGLGKLLGGGADLSVGSGAIKGAAPEVITGAAAELGQTSVYIPGHLVSQSTLGEKFIGIYQSVAGSVMASADQAKVLAKTIASLNHGALKVAQSINQAAPGLFQILGGAAQVIGGAVTMFTPGPFQITRGIGGFALMQFGFANIAEGIGRSISIFSGKGDPGSLIKEITKTLLTNSTKLAKPTIDKAADIIDFTFKLLPGGPKNFLSHVADFSVSLDAIDSIEKSGKEIQEAL